MAWAGLHRRLKAVEAYVAGLSVPKAVAWLVLAALLSSMPLVAAKTLHDDPGRVERTDIGLFRDRTDTILAGEWLYRDTDHLTLSPPLINYLMVPANLAGDTLAIWAAYFSLWNAAVGALLFIGLRRFSQPLAFAAALFYVSSPFSYVTSASMIQDDTIVPLFVAGAFLALMADAHARGAAWSGAGTLVKAWPGVGAPIVFLCAPGVRGKAVVAAVGLGIALLICLPFLVVVPDGFNDFLRFYVLGESPDGRWEGLSLWRFMDIAGLGFSQKLNLGALLLGYVVLWALVVKQRIGKVPAYAIAYFALFAVYPKLHFGYYLLAVVVALPWAVVRWQRLTGILAAAVAARIAHLFWRERLSVEGAGIYIAILVAAALAAYWAWWVVVVAKEGDFREQWDATAAPALGIGLGQTSLALVAALVTAVGPYVLA